MCRPSFSKFRSRPGQLRELVFEACRFDHSLEASNATGHGGGGGASPWPNSNYPASKLLTVKFPYSSHRPNEECKAIFLAGLKEPTQGNLPLRKPEGAKQ